MQTGKILLARTNAATQFRSALAQNAGEPLSLDLAGYSVGQRVDSILRSISVVSMEDRQWDFWFYGRSTMSAGPLVDIPFIGSWWFGVSGRQYIGTGLYHYYIEGLQIPVRDLDQTSKLHVVLINRSATAKSADDAGQLVVQFGLEMSLGC